jgi:hypothetical protein
MECVTKRPLSYQVMATAATAATGTFQPNAG